jgi:hypothetical protein
VRLLLR